MLVISFTSLVQDYSEARAKLRQPYYWCDSKKIF